MVFEPHLLRVDQVSALSFGERPVDEDSGKGFGVIGHAVDGLLIEGRK
jgi:hypothetical protein